MRFFLLSDVSHSFSFFSLPLLIVISPCRGRLAVFLRPVLPSHKEEVWQRALSLELYLSTALASGWSPVVEADWSSSLGAEQKSCVSLPDQSDEQVGISPLPSLSLSAR